MRPRPDNCQAAVTREIALRRVPIRMKLAGALAVPLAALVVVTLLEVVQSAADACRVREQTDLAEAAVGPLSLLSVIEDERNASAVYVMNLGDLVQLPIEDQQAARQVTDEAAAAFRAEVSDRGDAISTAYAPALAQLDALGDLRAQIDAVPPEQRSIVNIDGVISIFDGYSAIMDTFFAANKRVALAIDDPDLRRGAELTDLSARQTDTLARLVRDLLLAFAGGEHPDGLNSPAEIASVSRLLSQLRENEQQIINKATGDYRPLAEDLFASQEVQNFPPLVDDAIATGNVQLGEILTNAAGEDPETFGYTVFRNEATAELSRTADALGAAATARQRWFAVMALVAVFVAGIVTWLVSRSITRPLRSLTQQAKEMAERRLPDAVIDILETPLGDDVAVPRVEPVQVHTRDEVADVADALNIVQDTALDLAVEQAVLRRNIADSFVNLGRRNQNLLGRQLDFITELETNETDPDTLANLFRLDHLATRMRRNAESLLVLAGIEPPRKWAAPVRLTDVIRAALGEVEDYQRVTVRGVEPTTILGSAAADLAHLLAELIENALVFSPPDQTVDIRGRNRPDGYTLAIIDSGLGMPPADVTSANRRLAGAESFTIAPSKYLGHYVAGNLAARHNITVHLDNSPGNGITATIDLPPTLLTTDEAPAGHEDSGFRGIGMGAGTGPALHALPDGALVPGGWDDDSQPESFAPMAAPDPIPPPMPVGRTPSGLVKRAPGNGNGNGHGNGPQTTVGAGDPSGDLLDRLSRHSANLSPEGRGRSRSGLWGPLEPIGPATGRPPIDVGPAVPGPPPAVPSEPSPAPAAWAAPPAPTRPFAAPGRPEPRTAESTHEPAGPPGRVPGPFEPWPPTPLPAVGERPSTWPPPGDWPPEVRTPREAAPGELPATWPPPGDWPPEVRTPREAAPAAAPAPAPAQPTAAPAIPVTPPAAGEAVTAGGLTRRVRGAQMPTTEPLRMRRPADDDAPSAAPAPPTAARRVPPERTPEQRRAADDVYNFLTSFSAGVQRGLDESGRSQDA